MKNGILVGIDTRQQWSNYWRQGHLTSLPCGFSANYDGEFLQFWNAQFALLNSRSRVLDVCSGNGSIALLAQDYSGRHALSLQVKAIDAADIDVTALVEKYPKLARHVQAIGFSPNTLLEEVSEEADSVDLVTSQFGIEYTNWALSAQKIHRVLKPGGFFSMISHAYDSKIVIEMEIQQRDYSQVLDVELFSRGIEIAYARAYPGSFIKLLDRAIDTIYEIFKQDRTSDVLSGVGRELEKIRRQTLKDLNAGLKYFAQFEQGIKISYATSSDLLDVNRRLKQSPDWAEVFIEKGLELLRTEDIHYHTGENAGKAYQFRKSA